MISRDFSHSGNEPLAAPATNGGPPVDKYANDKRQQRSPYDYRRPGTRELQLIPKFVPSLPCFGPLLGPIFFGLLPAARRQSLDDLELAGEHVESHRLGDELVGVQVVALGDIALRRRRGEDQHRYRPQPGVGLHRAEHGVTAHPRQPQVEYHHVGPRDLLVRGLVAQEAQRGLAVLHERELVADPGEMQRFLDHHRVDRIVLDEQYLYGLRWAGHAASSPAAIPRPG